MYHFEETVYTTEIVVLNDNVFLVNGDGKRNQ